MNTNAIWVAGVLAAMVVATTGIVTTHLQTTAKLEQGLQEYKVKVGPAIITTWHEKGWKPCSND